jgi:potassium-transporting ATPase KdpC subunit
MSSHLRASLWLTLFSIGLAAIIYPAIVLAFGQGLYRETANGSLVYDDSGNVVGSSLIAQPFTGDEYFHPRPSAVGYNAASTAGSNWAGNNYLLRDRVAKALGPIVKYGSGEKKGQLVGPDIEAWFQGSSLSGRRCTRGPLRIGSRPTH